MQNPGGTVYCQYVNLIPRHSGSAMLHWPDILAPTSLYNVTHSTHTVLIAKSSNKPLSLLFGMVTLIDQMSYDKYA